MHACTRSGRLGLTESKCEDINYQDILRYSSRKLYFVLAGCPNLLTIRNIDGLSEAFLLSKSIPY